MGGPEPVSIAGVAVADVDLHRLMLACEVAGVIAEGVDTPVMGAVDGSFRRDCSANDRWTRSMLVVSEQNGPLLPLETRRRGQIRPESQTKFDVTHSQKQGLRTPD